MRETDDYTADIEDLLYDEDEGRPSERQYKPGYARFSYITKKIATIFQFILYTMPCFGYNITEN